MVLGRSKPNIMDSQQNGRWAMFTTIETRVNTRSCRLFHQEESDSKVPEARIHPASISYIGDSLVLLNDTGPELPESNQTARDFWMELQTHGGSWMWEHYEGDSTDMTWFRDALIAGSAMLVADGSYNWNVDQEVCGTGWVLVCRTAWKMVRGSFYDRTYSASAYRGELLGMVAAHALIANAHAVFNLSEVHGSVHCDNLGALGKARSRPPGEIINAASRCSSVNPINETRTFSQTGLQVCDVTPGRQNRVARPAVGSAAKCAV